MNKKIKHSKYKNTGILFEILVRQLAADVMSNKENISQAIIKEHFNGKSELLKELDLYNNINKEKFNSDSKADHFINAVLSVREGLNDKALRREKYNLIKSIKESYNVETFFKTKVSNYKVLASIYKLFEDTKSGIVSPFDSVKARFTLVEHITNSGKAGIQKSNRLINEYKEQDSDVRLLAYKILIEKFNSKYKGLNKNQKNVISEYINHISNSPKLTEFIKNETTTIKKAINSHLKKIDDKITKIKLTEVNNLLNKIKNKKSLVNDNDVLTIMRYYELTEELDNVNINK
jgi:hypothetical protein